MTTLWPDLVSRAIRAPSPHNVQPWKVQPASAREAVLYVDMNRALPAEDGTGSFLLCAMGLFVEALRIAARAHWLDLSMSLCEDSSRLARRMSEVANGLIPFARLTLTPATGFDADFPDALLDVRCTGRTEYKSTPLSDSAETLLRASAREGGLIFGATSDPFTVERLLDLNTRALFEDLNTPLYHDEIAQWFRCTQAEEESTRDGLSYRCMNMRSWEMKIAKHRPRVLKIPVLSQLFRRRYTRQNRCGSIGYLAGAFFYDPDVALAFGRGLLRFWLTAAAAGLSIHPLGNLVTNAGAAAQVEALTGVHQIWLIFKIGQLKGAAPRSLRRPVEEFLVV